jgi:DNA-binding response OmpR family regulator
MMRVLLTRWGYEVECANTGTQALENIKNKGCDLALIDLKLPDMSGKDLAPKIKAHHPNIPIIMITAFPPAELPGVDEIISKPLRADTLRQIVQSRIG